MTRSQLSSTSLADIVSSDYRTAAILDEYGLDYCCGGARSLADGCRQRNVDIEGVISELVALDSDSQPIGNQHPAALVDYIVAHHHTFVRMNAPLIRQHLAKVVARHAAKHPELSTIAAVFDGLADELRLHMFKEEQVLFPFIKALAEAIDRDAALPPNTFGTVQNPIRMMEHDHQDAADGLATMRQLSQGYAPPEDACTTYRLVLQELDAFEKDLHRHVHLENNVLFPKAIELEEKAQEELLDANAGS